MVTTKDRNDTILDQFKRIGSRRWTDGIIPPSKRREYIVTLTNHIRNIQDLAPQVIEFADAKEYPLAHCALDEIEKEVRRVHRHIDHLQNVTDFCARPAGHAQP